ncbi:MAG: FlgD immunoglobulin-like domain containing protein [Candidatus Krumholzibacteriia bacterium]
MALLHEGIFDAGEKLVTWDGSDDRGKPLPSGHYCFRLELTNGRGSTGKMTLLK